MNRIEFPAWYGEFGWEVMTWAPFCRKEAQGHDHIVVTSFAGTEPLYADFATEFRAHDQTGRSLTYPKRYRVDGEYVRYGRPDQAQVCFDVLIHGRGVTRKNSINYRAWPALVELLHRKPWSIGWIGGPQDHVEPLCGFDLRGRELQKLMDIVARSKIVIGVSSGLMHLAAACGTDLVVWGDKRTYFGETLEQRYKVTWNPHNVKVGWLMADDWQPRPETVIEQIERTMQ